MASEVHKDPNACVEEHACDRSSTSSRLSELLTPKSQKPLDLSHKHIENKQFDGELTTPALFDLVCDAMPASIGCGAKSFCAASPQLRYCFTRQPFQRVVDIALSNEGYIAPEGMPFYLTFPIHQNKEVLKLEEDKQQILSQRLLVSYLQLDALIGDVEEEDEDEALPNKKKKTFSFTKPKKKKPVPLAPSRFDIPKEAWSLMKQTALAYHSNFHFLTEQGDFTLLLPRKYGGEDSEEEWELHVEYINKEKIDQFLASYGKDARSNAQDDGVPVTLGLKHFDGRVTIAESTGMPFTFPRFFQECKLSALNMSPLSEDFGYFGPLFCAGCSNLKMVYFGEKGLPLVVELGGGFLECSAVESVDISTFSALKSIGPRFLYRCTFLKNVKFGTLPDLASISVNSLERCVALEEVDFSGLANLEELGWNILKMTIYNDHDRVTSYEGYEKDQGVTAARLKSVKFGPDHKKLQSIGEMFCMDATELGGTVDLRGATNLKHLHHYFLLRSGVESVLFPDELPELEFIGVSCLADMPKLQTVKLPTKMTNLQMVKQEFLGCNKSLEEVDLCGFTSPNLAVESRFLVDTPLKKFFGEDAICSVSDQTIVNVATPLMHLSLPRAVQLVRRFIGASTTNDSSRGWASLTFAFLLFQKAYQKKEETDTEKTSNADELRSLSEQFSLDFAKTYDRKKFNNDADFSQFVGLTAVDWMSDTDPSPFLYVMEIVLPTTGKDFDTFADTFLKNNSPKISPEEAKEAYRRHEYELTFTVGLNCLTHIQKLDSLDVSTLSPEGVKIVEKQRPVMLAIGCKALERALTIQVFTGADDAEITPFKKYWNTLKSMDEAQRLINDIPEPLIALIKKTVAPKFGFSAAGGGGFGVASKQEGGGSKKGFAKGFSFGKKS